MGFFSDPASASVEVSMELLSVEADPDSPGTPTSKRSQRPRRTKSMDQSALESPRMPAKIRNLRHSSISNKMPSVFRDSASMGTSSGPNSRRGSMADGSMNSSIGGSSSMQDHLEDIEAFCNVMKQTPSKERNRMLKESINHKEQRGRKKSMRRTKSMD
ncbi:expressed unknown protein [Seminavis robusta]|uniref:Uncharacterized protein n=1 Tax=Seminavis robusta TaxID=568900 RepID=A0A9N8HYV9_9STRA|nr:expressed unknown protein [Seminavis robusta]|eukprot:Sro2665_g334110.1 n/a (159) ;mRNA; r:3822-4298